MSFPPRYAGECGDCGQGIVRGQEVTYQGDAGVVHAVCPRSRPVCPRCFIEVNHDGSCDNCD